MLARFGGRDGLPYSEVLDASGAFIANSKMNDENIRYPAEPKEIDYFVQMMKMAAPRMSESDLKTIDTALRSFKRARASS